MSQTNNNTEIKEQDTQDEIIWEGKKDIPSFLLYWITYIALLCFFLYWLPRVFDNTKDFKWFVAFFYVSFNHICICTSDLSNGKY
ncbi:hypothetical protein ACSGY6_001600 [Campylobacter jejuni]|nr:hypothetical protein [Campylobacter jejuni]